MAIGINDLDDIDDLDSIQSEESPETGELSSNELIEDTNKDTNKEQNDSSTLDQKEDFMQFLLKSKGIEDMSKIKFENDEGSVEEVNWDDLSNEEKFNILNSSDNSPETDLDDNEIQLINAIRSSGLTPSEYLQKLQNDGIDSYIQNSQAEAYQYQVDQFDDDELFIYDFLSRMGDVTKEEAQEALERAKSNESLFAKQIGAIRNEYKSSEEESIRQSQIEQEAQAQEQYEQFANTIADQIDNLSDFSGYDLNMDDEDKQSLYEFITGVDGAGNNYFAKALSDPETLVKIAWFALNGEQMIDDITEYFQKEISKVRKESYTKGKTDATKSKPDVIYKDKQRERSEELFDDLD